VGVSIGHLSSLAHVVLQVLPADPGGEILNDQSVLRAGGRSILVGPVGSAAITVAVTASVTTASTTTSAAIASGGSSSVLDDDALTAHFLAVQLVDSIISIPVVVKLNESITVLQQDLPDSAVAFEESFNVSFATLVWQATNVNSGTHPYRIKNR